MRIDLLIAGLVLAMTASVTEMGRRKAPGLPPALEGPRNGSQFVEARFDVPATHIWSILPTVLLDLGIEPQVDTTQVGLIGNTRIINPVVGNERTSRFVTCGSNVGPGAANMYRIRLNLLIHVRPDGTGTRTYTYLAGTGRSVHGSGSNAIPCKTTGRLEQRIISDINAHLAAFSGMSGSGTRKTAP